MIDYLQNNIPFFVNSIKNESQIDGSLLSNIFYKSIFTENHDLLPLIPSDHVGNKQGTGLVHIAPALGQDDFKLAVKHNLTLDCVIDELGKYSTNDKILKKFQLSGKSVLDPTTIQDIKTILSESIIHQHEHIHSYPYDWRTKKPCIIRSSMQWFIDTNKLKTESLNKLKNVKIRPNNVTNSMNATLISRPYWCISRQRSWGLPIPCFFTNEHK